MHDRGSYGSARSIDRRQLLKRTAAAGAGLAGAALASGNAAAAGSARVPTFGRAPAVIQDSTTVTIWTWREEDAEVWGQAQDRIRETAPGLTLDVQAIKSTEYAAKVNTAMQGGQGPDIITTRAGAGYFQPFVEAEMFVPLTDQVPELSNLSPGTISQVSFEDQVYAVPFASQVSFFYYNTDIFATHQLSPPNTWDELVQTMEALKENGETPLFTPTREGWALSLYVDCIGATFLGDEFAAQLIAGEKRFTDEKFIGLLARLQSLQPYFQEGYAGNNTADMDQAFQTGRAAMLVYGGWAAKQYLQEAPDLTFDFFLSPPDAPDGKRQSYVFLDGGYAVNSASQVQDAALEAVKFSATQEYGQIFTNVTGEMSSIPGVEAPAEEYHLQRQLELASEEYALQHLFRIRAPFNDGTPDLYSILNAGLEGLWGNQISPEDLAQQIQDGLDQWYPAFQE